eukprot:m.227935 g.227935  ORF g.227935 m.227935 type:complete len:351 (-) comp17362_c0_seq1:45-1097(-)
MASLLFRSLRAAPRVAVPSIFTTRAMGTSGNKKPKILVTGAMGQLGSELIGVLRGQYGVESVIATDIRIPRPEHSLSQGPYFYGDVLDYKNMESLVVNNRVDWVFHLSALLSAVGEKNVQQALAVNNVGFQNMLELSRVHNLRIFCPSTIGAFGPTTPRDNTPDLCIMRPTTVYGVTKVFMELLGEYYNKRFGVDFRSLRLPGVISADSPPGGGTTDYAVDIFHHAINRPAEPYVCYLRGDTRLPMIMMSDCLKGIVQFMQADPARLTARTYNLNAISFTPTEITAAIRARVPSFASTFEPDFRQAIADSWPRSLDDSKGRADWGWQHEYDMDKLVDHMLTRLRAKAAAH